MNYTHNSGTVLPGYTPGVGFLVIKTIVRFYFGSQDDVRYEAAKNGWLTNYPDFNQNFSGDK
jgi:cell surface protein SprA